MSNKMLHSNEEFTFSKCLYDDQPVVQTRVELQAANHLGNVGRVAVHAGLKSLGNYSEVSIALKEK